MLKFKDSYYENEVRDGFFVPAMIKKAWAAELAVMYEVDKICRKHNITYFADWGTMLGAVRHGGFIPWDDDFDIMMRRKDYEHFLQVAENELPEGFAILNMDNTENFWYFLSRIVLRPQICFEEEHLKQFHGFPYIVGIDIFILDTMSSDTQKEKQRDKVIEYILALADSLGTNKLSSEKKETALCRIEQICGVKIERVQPESELKMKLYQLVRKLMIVFEDDEKGHYAQLIPHVVYYENAGFPQNYYQDGIRIPFENIEIMLPVRYEAMLQKKYGNYMRLVRNKAGHNYPFFQSQKEQFEEILGYQLPRYKYPGICPRQNTIERSCKYQIRQFLCKFDQIHEQIHKGNHMVENLIEAQGNAIDMGNLIEQVKGENHPVVRELEQYCEVVFELYREASQKYQDISQQKMKELESLKDRVESQVNELVLKRKEAVFLPFSGKYWDSLHSVWEAVAAESDWDVYVVPLPYYYKEYDGSFLDMVYDLSEYPANILLADYENFDLALRHPEAIFIQNPYDEWDSATSIPKEYYSSVIRNYTEQLIYIPYFELEEFDKNNEREYWNMNYYCTVPGVVNADWVFVQSQNMKNVYVDKLTAFAGEETEEIWQKKIVGIGSPLSDYKKAANELDVSVLHEWKQIIRKPDGETKKLLLFYISMSALIQYQEKMIEKIKDAIDVASESKEEAVFVWKEDPLISLNGKAIAKAIGKELYEEYQGLRTKITDGRTMIYAECVEDDVLVAVCDGYYGVPSALGNKFQVSHKPIMICDLE